MNSVLKTGAEKCHAYNLTFFHGNFTAPKSRKLPIQEPKIGFVYLKLSVFTFVHNTLD